MILTFSIWIFIALSDPSGAFPGWMSDLWAGAKWWDAWVAFGTVSATVVAVVLGYRGSLQGRQAQEELKADRKERAALDRIAAPSLVSAWIESNFVVTDNRQGYRRKDVLYAANESNEPVFDVQLVVGAGHPRVQIGPLAAPRAIPVLPARSQRKWDISHGLLAHLGPFQIPAEAVASIDFNDSRDVRWSRDFDGRLQEMPSSYAVTPISEEEGRLQLGDENFFNPIWTAICFLNILRSEENPVTVALLSPLFAANAPGLSELTEEDWRQQAKALNDYSTPLHVWYPASNVAYVRLIPDQSVSVARAGGAVQGVQFLTLVFYAGVGWHIFSIGGRTVAPDWIKFPEGGLSEDARGDQTEG